MKITQNLLEALVHGKTTGDVRVTQAIVETAEQNPAAEDVKSTQSAMEVLEGRLVDVDVTQMCIEVAWPRSMVSAPTNWLRPEAPRCILKPMPNLKPDFYVRRLPAERRGA